MVCFGCFVCFVLRGRGRGGVWGGWGGQQQHENTGTAPAPAPTTLLRSPQGLSCTQVLLPTYSHNQSRVPPRTLFLRNHQGPTESWGPPAVQLSSPGEEGKQPGRSETENESGSGSRRSRALGTQDGRPPSLPPFVRFLFSLPSFPRRHSHLERPAPSS